MAPQVHRWTIDLNEGNVVAAVGWTQEGIAVLVLSS